MRSKKILAIKKPLHIQSILCWHTNHFLVAESYPEGHQLNHVYSHIPTRVDRRDSVRRCVWSQLFWSYAIPLLQLLRSWGWPSSHSLADYVSIVGASACRSTSHRDIDKEVLFLELPRQRVISGLWTPVSVRIVYGGQPATKRLAWIVSYKGAAAADGGQNYRSRVFAYRRTDTTRAKVGTFG